MIYQAAFDAMLKKGQKKFLFLQDVEKLEKNFIQLKKFIYEFLFTCVTHDKKDFSCQRESCRSSATYDLWLKAES